MPITPRRVRPSSFGLDHQDYLVLSSVADEISRRIPAIDEVYPELALDALEFVLDPVRTGRTRLSELDNVEKTFVGLKVEHFLRDRLDAPKGVRDLVLAGHNVDVKNTVSDQWSWMIPPETYREREPCLIAALDEKRREVWLGLIVAHPEYLRPGKNRDQKMGIQAAALANILWLVQARPLPRDRWAEIDMVRFRELRQMMAGSKRAATFFQENLRLPVHRSVIQALLHDQLDYMKRLRDNGGAKDILRPRRVALLSGTFFNEVLERLGLERIGRDEHIAIDARTESEEAILREIGEL